MPRRNRHAHTRYVRALLRMRFAGTNFPEAGSRLAHGLVDAADYASQHVHRDRAGPDIDVGGQGHTRREPETVWTPVQREVPERDPCLVIGLDGAAVVVL